MIGVFTLIAHQKTTGFDNTNPMDNDLCKLTAMFMFDAEIGEFLVLKKLWSSLNRKATKAVITIKCVTMMRLKPQHHIHSLNILKGGIPALFVN